MDRYEEELLNELDWLEGIGFLPPVPTERIPHGEFPRMNLDIKNN